MTDSTRGDALPLGRWLGLAVAAAVLWLVLVQPNHPDALAGMPAHFPLELPALLLGLAALLPGRGATAVRVALVALLVLSSVLRATDLATFAALERPFHPLLDLHLLVSGWRLGSGAIGAPVMAGAAVAAVVAVAAVTAALWWATGRLVALELAAPWRAVAAGGALLAAAVAVTDAGRRVGGWRVPDPPGSAFALTHLAQRAAEYPAALAALAAFREEAARDPWAGAAPLFDRIGGRDVLVVFVESYGAASLTNPTYAATHRATLTAAERDLAAAGLAMRSGWLQAPTFGGQSWLSHATLASGLRVDNQRSYGAYLASPRRSLFHLAQAAGFRTAAVMPAITLDWPEAALMGFDRVLPAAALGYRGLPFDWVTMPDQFALEALDRLVLGPEPGPVLAQVALVSSHAPWVPVPEMVAWEALGDGAVFDAQVRAGEAVEAVWRDDDRIRDAYRRSIDYSLTAALAYAGRHASDPPLMVLLGDHPPARFVAQDESVAVPVHLIGPPDLVALVEGWGWTVGLVPAEDVPAWPMEAFRDRFLAAFSSGGP